MTTAALADPLQRGEELDCRFCLGRLVITARVRVAANLTQDKAKLPNNSPEVVAMGQLPWEGVS